jgi:hypothetical protein
MSTRKAFTQRHGKRERNGAQSSPVGMMRRKTSIFRATALLFCHSYQISVLPLVKKDSIVTLKGVVIAYNSISSCSKKKKI